ncbi:hypothetical protein CGLO_16463 [Colletotrichum gloeosporioides Cg-14]
MEMLH